MSGLDLSDQELAESQLAEKRVVTKHSTVDWIQKIKDEDNALQQQLVFVHNIDWITLDFKNQLLEGPYPMLSDDMPILEYYCIYS